MAAEAQAELDKALSVLAQTPNPRGDWCTEEGNTVKLYREISLSVEMTPPTVPLKLRNPKLPKEEPQVVKHAGKRWVAIPEIEGDALLMQAAVALAQRAVTLHGWVYDIKTGEVSAYDEASMSWISVEERYAADLAGSMLHSHAC